MIYSDNLIVEIAISFIMLSFLAVGGAPGMIPELHRLVVENHSWLNNTEFAQLFAIAQIAPGPNILVISLIGWHLAGFAGMIAATCGAIIPSSILALIVGRLVGRIESASWYPILKAAIPPVVVGLLLSAGVVTTSSADATPLAFLLSALSAAFVAFTSRNPLWILGFGALSGLVAGRFGYI
jgi:chromate transporter